MESSKRIKLHPGLTFERWFKFTLLEQLANIGTDISRCIRWKNKGDLETSRNVFYRALELVDVTIADPKNKGHRLKEILRVREAIIDHFLCDNEYNTTDEQWHNYFFDFNYAAALAKGK